MCKETYKYSLYIKILKLCRYYFILKSSSPQSVAEHDWYSSSINKNKRCLLGILLREECGEVFRLGVTTSFILYRPSCCWRHGFWQEKLRSRRESAPSFLTCQREVNYPLGPFCCPLDPRCIFGPDMQALVVLKQTAPKPGTGRDEPPSGFLLVVSWGRKC